MEQTMESKTLIYCKAGAVESPLTYEAVKDSLRNGNKEITSFINKDNPKTGRLDKYLCITYIEEVSHIVDLQGECIYNSEDELKVEENVKENEEIVIDNTED